MGHSLSPSKNTIVLQTTLFFVFILILTFISVSDNSKNVGEDLGTLVSNTNDYAVGSFFNCRRCKVYIRADVGNVGISPPPENPSSGNNKRKMGVIVGLTVSLVFIILSIITWMCWKKRRYSETVTPRPPPPPPPPPPIRVPPPPTPVPTHRQLKIYTYDYLKIMTNNFTNKIGEGSFGKVYEGILSDGKTMVAVKRLKFGGKDDFRNEVRALGRAHHSNLVKLIGYCDDGRVRVLVYEYMSNGSLEKRIFHANPTGSLLTWSQKKNIILGIANGLMHLHDNCSKKIWHRDLKPANVVLDNNMNAKLCDFGLAKLVDKDQSSTSNAYVGTLEYMAPEVKNGERLTEKIDVYSFGIVVLEILFGKQYCYLVKPGYKRVKDNQLTNLINKNLSLEMRENANEIEKIGKLAVWCIHEKPEDRPSMSAVVNGMRYLNSLSSS